MNLSTKSKQSHRDTEQTCACQGGGGGSGVDGEFGVIKLLDLEWISNEVLLYSTGNYIQCFGIAHDGRGYKKGNVYVQDWVSLLSCRNGHNIANQLQFKER